MLPNIESLVAQLRFPARGLRAVLVQGEGGGWGDETGSSRGISGPADLTWLLANRAVADAVVVGAATLRRERYRPIQLRPELAAAREAVGLSGRVALVAFTRSATDLAAVVEVADLVVTTAVLAESAGSPKVVGVGGLNQSDLEAALAELRSRGWHRLVLEGGPRLVDAFAAAGLLDQLALTRSPLPAAGAPALPALAEFIARHPAIHLAAADGFDFALHGLLPEWRDLLSPAAYKVLRKHGTEPAFSADYEKQPAPGYYTCAACGQRLFEADTQFDARCGWPAFWRPSGNDAVRLIADRSWGMVRTEVRCAACDSHLGHVFEGEGFGFPTDQRYCINAISLRRVR